MLAGRRILLIIGGGIAAYKSLELIRLLQKAGAGVTPVLTAAAAEFVTPLTVSALAGVAVHRALFDLTESHRIYTEDGVDAYHRYQVQHEEEILAPGPAFVLAQKLLRLNRPEDRKSTRLNSSHRL